jgi:uncharacterized lipoprotein YehR (DUF1307 family)
MSNLKNQNKMKNLMMILVVMMFSLTFVGCNSEKSTFEKKLKETALDPSSVKIIKFEKVDGDFLNDLKQREIKFDSVEWYDNQISKILSESTDKYSDMGIEGNWRMVSFYCDCIIDLLSKSSGEVTECVVPSLVVEEILKGSTSLSKYHYTFESRNRDGSTSIETGSSYFNQDGVNVGNLSDNDECMKGELITTLSSLYYQHSKEWYNKIVKETK